ncbi:DUF6864 domain-containing function [Bacteroides caecicola]|uniref:DUF6864 domain-containing function n=1 Tax=Bacteroides caecicola TaxID=1462569 RepID=UPI00201268DD|nr:hypothetical protein [Bacteroides caecicola]MCL1625736.1 hypothetical protein [Bacteroides caecicola]
MEFKEKISEYTIIHHGEIIVYNDQEIQIELTDTSGPLILKIHFLNSGGRVSSFTSEVNENVQILTFKNFERNESLGGLFEPVEIAKMDDGSSLYFNCAIYTENAKDGDRLFKYSFLKRE